MVVVKRMAHRNVKLTPKSIARLELIQAIKPKIERHKEQWDDAEFTDMVFSGEFPLIRGEVTVDNRNFEVWMWDGALPAGYWVLEAATDWADELYFAAGLPVRDYGPFIILCTAKPGYAVVVFIDDIGTTPTPDQITEWYNQPV